MGTVIIGVLGIVIAVKCGGSIFYYVKHNVM